MIDIDLRKDLINYEIKPLEETDSVTIKGEYLIPDTNPDVYKILLLEANPKITNLNDDIPDKVIVEGEITYNLIYLSKDMEENIDSYTVSHQDKFSIYLNISGAKQDNLIDVTCELIKSNYNLINDRKISIESLIHIKGHSIENSKLEIVKSIENSQDVQVLNKTINLCLLNNVIEEEISCESLIQIPLDRLPIHKILLCDARIYKTEVRLSDNKITYNSYVKVKILYKGTNSKEIYPLEHDIYLGKDCEENNVDSSMLYIDSFSLQKFEYVVDEDDLGESRVINIQLKAKCLLRLFRNEEFETIEDAYSRESYINLVKNIYKMNFVNSCNTSEFIIRDSISPESLNDIPTQILYSSGRCSVKDKKINDGKIILSGLVNSSIIYKNNNDDQLFSSIYHDIPFSCAIENPDVKLDTDLYLDVKLENIESIVEAKSISIKCVLNIRIISSIEIKKEILVDVYRSQVELQQKQSSMIIYSVMENDTLWGIAKNYYVTIEDLCRINEIEENEDIQGKKLIIPYNAKF